MKNFGAAVFPLLLLGLVAGLTYWLARTANVDDLDSRAKARHDPDSMISHFGIRHFDAEGNIKQTLVAENMVHFPDDDTSEVTKPTMTFNLNPQPLRVNSQRAWLNRDGKEVRLYGAVHLVRQGEPGSPDTELDTAQLTVFPDTQLAHTDVPVTITQGLSVLTGSGGDYDGNKHVGVLRGRARGIFYKKAQ